MKQIHSASEKQKMPPLKIRLVNENRKVKKKEKGIPCFTRENGPLKTSQNKGRYKMYRPDNSMSGKRGSNPRPSAWEADALPLSYSREDAANLTEMILIPPFFLFFIALA